MTRTRMLALAGASAAVLVPAVLASPAAAIKPGQAEQMCDGRLSPAQERRCEHIELLEEKREEAQREHGGSDQPARETPKGGERDRGAARGRRARGRRGRRARGRRGARGRGHSHSHGGGKGRGGR